MKSNQKFLFSRMFPDFSVAAPAGAAGGTASGVEPSPGQTSRPATFAEVINSVGEFYAAIEEQTSLRFFPRLGKSGLMVAGEFWTLSGLEWPKEGDGFSVCSLTETLETASDLKWGGVEAFTSYLQKYFLSPKACRGILRRAERRGKQLPERLMQTLVQVASTEET